MKKLIAFLSTVAMLLSLSACGNIRFLESKTDARRKAESNRDKEIAEDVFLSPEDFQDPAFFGRMFDGEIGYAEYHIASEMFGKTGVLYYEYRGDDRYYCCFFASFWEDREDCEEGEIAPLENRHDAEKYYKDVCSYIENHWGEPTDRESDCFIWELSDYYGFEIDYSAEYAEVEITYWYEAD